MTSISPRSILDGTALFSNLSELWKERLAQLAYLSEFSAGQVILREGDAVPGLYCVSAGLVRVVKDGPRGRQLVLHLAQPGQTFAEVAVFGNFAAPASAEAIKDTTCAVIPSTSLRALLELHHDLCLGLLGSTALWVRALVTRLEDIVLWDASARLARYLLQASSASAPRVVELPVLKKDLAAHLNVTQETLSRTLKKLSEADPIESLPDGTAQILDLPGLANLGGKVNPDFESFRSGGTP